VCASTCWLIIVIIRMAIIGGIGIGIDMDLINKNLPSEAVKY
jgi:hypothetical protein